jgi:hypothetical protein
VGPSAGPSVLASVPRGGAFELRNTKFGTLHAPHTWQHVFAATHAIYGPTPLPSLHHTDDGVCCRCSSPLQETIFQVFQETGMPLLASR